MAAPLLSLEARVLSLPTLKLSFVLASSPLGPLGPLGKRTHARASYAHKHVQKLQTAVCRSWGESVVPIRATIIGREEKTEARMRAYLAYPIKTMCMQVWQTGWAPTGRTNEEMLWGKKYFKLAELLPAHT